MFCDSFAGGYCALFPFVLQDILSGLSVGILSYNLCYGCSEFVGKILEMFSDF